MDTETYSNISNHLRYFMKKVNDDIEPLIVTSKKHNNDCILISKGEYDNLIENIYIRSSQANVEYIMKSWADLKTEKGKEHDK